MKEPSLRLPLGIDLIQGAKMAATTTFEGNVDNKPLQPAVKAKVESALKSALESEITSVIVPTHHFSITHYSVVYDKV
jgi:hypothetical protein